MESFCLSLSSSIVLRAASTLACSLLASALELARLSAVLPVDLIMAIFSSSSPLSSSLVLNNTSYSALSLSWSDCSFFSFPCATWSPSADLSPSTTRGVVEMQRVAPVREDLRYRFRTVRNRLYGVSDDPHVKPLSRTVFIISVTDILGSLEPRKFGLVGHIVKSVTELGRHKVSARYLGLSQGRSQDKISGVF